MNPPPLRLYYDLVDPLSWLLAREVSALARESGQSRDPADTLEWIPLELRPPPLPLIAQDDPSLEARWTEARALLESSEPGRTFDPPLLVPWSRKAHELVVHAGGEGVGDELRARLFEGYLFEGWDIGRVDVLVEAAVSAGLDRTGAKAVLDVDKHEAEVAAFRTRAAEAGITRTPTLALGERRIEGFHNGAAIRTFLGT